MKTWILVASLIIVLTVIISENKESLIQKSFAMCAQDKDWPNGTCFDVRPVLKSEYQQKMAEYYEYKGAEWMEMKKTEMLQAIDNGTFVEWLDNNESGYYTNWNVMHYYHSIGEVSYPDGYNFPLASGYSSMASVDNYWYVPSLSWVLIGGVTAGISTITVFVIKRK